MSAKSSTIKKNKGVALIEVVFYLAVLTLFMGAVVKAFLAMGEVYKNIKAERELEISGTIAMENMLREIRGASSVALAQSFLGASPGSLALAGADENLNPYSVYFSADSGTIFVSKNGGAAVPLVPSDVQAARLVFYRAVNANSEGVRIELEMSSTASGTLKSEKFYGFAVLRGSY